MTTPTPHGAPELDAQAFDVTSAWLRHSKTAATGGQLAAMCSFAKFILESRAAIQQAAGAVPEGLVPCPTCNQTGIVTELDGSFFRQTHCPSCNGHGKCASPSPLGREAGKEGSSDHLVPCAGGGVTQPLTNAKIKKAYADTDQGGFDEFVAGVKFAEAAHGINPGSAPREDGHGQS